VERWGDSVHRRAGEWTPAIHALLLHLRTVGFAGAPRPVGLHDDVEILTFMPGGGASHSDEELASVGKLIRAFHDASRSFLPPPGSRWQFMVGAPRSGDVICHNDLSPDNTVFEPLGSASAFIDWDLAAPAPRLWDLAWAAYRFVPLYDESTAARLGYPIGRQAERLRILCETYALSERGELLPTVCRRIRVLYDTARRWGEDGRPGWRDVWRDTRGEQWLRGLRNVEAHRSDWQRLL
jgi:Ser/Thr protein kinase RdoA (MazF antagonist)